jgi:hypothetical protein
MIASAIVYTGNLHAAPAKPKTAKPAAAGTKAAAPAADCITTSSCATLRPQALGDTLTLRPGKDNIPIRAARDPENFLTMKAVTLGVTLGECGDINEPNKPITGDTMTIAPKGDGTFLLSLTASGAATPKLQATLSAHSEPLGGTNQLFYLSGSYTGTADTYEFAAYLLDRKPYSTSNFQKQYRLEIFDSKCTAARPETQGNIDPKAPALAAATTHSMVRTPRKIPCEGPIGQGGQPPWPG